jgi:glucose/arabinose dehydrogenase
LTTARQQFLFYAVPAPRRRFAIVSGALRGALLMALTIRGFCADTSTSTSTNAFPTLALKAAFPNLRLPLPLWIGWPPDGTQRLFAAGQDGQVWLLPTNRASKDLKVFMDLTDRKPHEQYEEGFLGLAFHPQFKTNHKFYVAYNQQFPKRTVLSEFQISATDPDRADMGTERVLLEIPKPYWNHNSGCLLFGPDGYLYMSVGDGGQNGDPHNFGQSLHFIYGKIIRIDVDSRAGRVPYGVPKDNPFVGNLDSDYRPETWAYGLRNPWRMSFDRLTGDLWAGDVGQDKWEEVDFIVKGGNYGWSDREGFHQFRDVPLGTNWIDPVIEYGHTAALQKEGKFPDHGAGNCVIGGYVYRGKALPEIYGVYVYADYVVGTVWGLRYENGHLTNYGTLVKSNPVRPITSFGEDWDGELYATSFDGKIYQLVRPTPPKPPAQP